MADAAFKIDSGRQQKLSGMVLFVPKAVSSNVQGIDNAQVKYTNDTLVPYQAAALDARYSDRFDDKTYYTT